MALNPKLKQKPTNNPFTEDDEPEKPSKAPSEEGIERVQTKDENPHEKEVSVEPDEDEETGPSRAERRRERKERYDEMERAKNAAEARAAQAEQLAAALRAQQMVAPREAEKRADPLDEEEKRLLAERMDMLKLADQLNQAKTPLPPDQVQQWREKYLAIEAKQRNVAMRRAVRDAGSNQPQNTDDQVMIASLRMRYPDVAGDNIALKHAEGLANIRMAKMAKEGRRPQLSLQDYEQVMEQTRRDLRMPGAGSPAPSEETRRKFSGQPVGGGNSAAGRGPQTITMNKAQMKMAEAQFKTERDPKTGKSRRLSPAEAHAKWARTHGKKLLEAG